MRLRSRLAVGKFPSDIGSVLVEPRIEVTLELVVGRYVERSSHGQHRDVFTGLTHTKIVTGVPAPRLGVSAIATARNHDRPMNFHDGEPSRPQPSRVVRGWP